MPRPKSRTVFVVVPGASQSPSHYAQILHLLHCNGYPTYTAVLPSTGTPDLVTPENDKDYIRDHMLLPVLDIENHNVIMIMHSYSGIPGSAAATGLGKSDRVAQGKTTWILGQIYIASILAKGGDGKDIVQACGGQLPPHIGIGVGEADGLLTCDDPGPPLYGDVQPQEFQDVMVLGSMCPSKASFMSPCPRASWDSADFKGRCAFIRTLKDRGIPLEAQNMFLQATGEDWIIRDMDTGHSPQISAPEKLCDTLLELAKQFEL